MASTRPRPRAVPWLAGLSTALGGFTAGIGGNLVAADFLYRGFAVLCAATAVLATAAWLRGFKPDFVLVIWVVRGFLLIAVAAVVAATMVSPTQVGYAVLVAALATLGATLIRSDPFGRLAMLCAVTLIAYGAGLLVTAGQATSEGRFVMVTMGVLSALLGIAALGQGWLIVDLARATVEVLLEPPLYGFYLLGGFFAFVGTLAAANGAVPVAVVMFLIMLGAAGMAFGHNHRRPPLVGLSAVLAGLAIALGGTLAIIGGEALFGAAPLGMGVTITVAGVTDLWRRGVLGRWRSWLDAAKKDAYTQQTGPWRCQGPVL